MSQAVAAPRFTVGVFQDLVWAERGVRALLDAGFTPSALSLMALDSDPARLLIESLLGGTAGRLDVRTLGPLTGAGALLDALQGADCGLERDGLASVMNRAGFQQHDGYIFETLVGRGGVLTAVSSEARTSDALAKLHAYGGGNAAIGAWTGRV